LPGLHSLSLACRALRGQTVRLRSKRRKSMTDPNSKKNEMLVMWIGSAAIVLLLLAAMGINMLITHNTSTGSTDTSSQSSTVPPK
jgi:flagellar basal body-associated protein FliL